VLADLRSAFQSTSSCDRTYRYFCR